MSMIVSVATRFLQGVVAVGWVGVVVATLLPGALWFRLRLEDAGIPFVQKFSEMTEGRAQVRRESRKEFRMAVAASMTGGKVRSLFRALAALVVVSLLAGVSAHTLRGSATRVVELVAILGVQIAWLAIVRVTWVDVRNQTRERQP